MNGMMYIRGNREDYDDWEAMGNPGWKYDDVLPYFKKSENNMELDQVGSKYHAAGGLLPVGKFPYNPPLSYAILKGGEELGRFSDYGCQCNKILIKNCILQVLEFMI